MGQGGYGQQGQLGIGTTCGICWDKAVMNKSGSRGDSGESRSMAGVTRFKLLLFVINLLGR